MHIDHVFLIDMELTVKGQAGSDAKLAIAVAPGFASTVVLGEGPNAQIISPSTSFTKVGTFPLKIKIFFLFNKRPWQLDIQQENGTMFSTTSEAQQLNTATIITPDIASLILNFFV